MDESKIGLTERLRREGRWAEASKFKDETVKKLRADGMKRAEAGEQAWQKMAEVYPRLPPPEPASEPVAGEAPRADTAEDEDMVARRLCDAAEQEVERWQQKHGVVVPDDASVALAGGVVAYCWALGLMGEIPSNTR